MNSHQPLSPQPITEPEPSRREFLAKTALLTGGILAFGLPLPSRQSRSALAAAPQSAGIRYALELEGQVAGPIFSLESGFISGQVSEQILPQSPYPKKHLATIAYEEMAIECGNTSHRRSICGFSRLLQDKHLKEVEEF